MAKVVIVFALLAFTSSHLFAWARVSNQCCPVGPGPGYCSCYWMDKGGKKVPDSDWCGDDTNGAGGCVKDADCFRIEPNAVQGPVSFPPFNICLVPVSVYYWC